MKPKSGLLGNCIKLGICISFFFIVLQSCDNPSGYGTIDHIVKFTTDTSESVQKDASLKNASENRYTQFGTYITSLTPYIFKASIRMMNYQDYWDITSDKTHGISYLGENEEYLYVDFSNNQEVSITPTLYSRDLHGDRIFGQKQVTFNYFNFVPQYLYQEVELPSEYTNLHLNQVDYLPSARFGNILKINNDDLLRDIISTGFTFVFGNTDYTYIFNEDHQVIGPSENNPFGDDGSGFSGAIIRSSNYTPVTVTMPDEDQTITMYSTVSFNTQDLIQVYSGNDNIPFTSDDVFVYAPYYWERVKVKLEIR